MSFMREGFIGSIILFCTCYIAFHTSADTFTNKKTGETFTGTLQDAKINNLQLVIKEDGRRVYLNLADYNVVVVNDDTDNEDENEDDERIPDRDTVDPIVYVVPISGEILIDAETPWGEICKMNMDQALEYSVRLARKAHADYFVLKIDSPGGSVSIAEKMVAVLCNIEDMVTVAYVQNMGHRESLSAAALVTLSCKYIFMADGSTIGAATPFLYEDGAPQVKEKFISAFRARFRATAKMMAHSPELAEAMVDERVAVYLVKTEDDQKLIEADDEETAVHKSTFPPEDIVEIEVVSKAGEILTLSAEEAERLGLSNGTVDSVPRLCKELQLIRPIQRGGKFPCGACFARGWLPCPKCKGKGRFTCEMCAGKGWTTEKQICKRCAGYGVVDTGSRVVACSYCAGTGYKLKPVACPSCNKDGLAPQSLDGYTTADLLRWERETGWPGRGMADCTFCSKGKLKCPFCNGKKATD